MNIRSSIAAFVTRSWMNVRSDMLVKKARISSWSMRILLPVVQQPEQDTMCAQSAANLSRTVNTLSRLPDMTGMKVNLTMTPIVNMVQQELTPAKMMAVIHIPRRFPLLVMTGLNTGPNLPVMRKDPLPIPAAGMKRIQRNLSFCPSWNISGMMVK